MFAGYISIICCFYSLFGPPGGLLGALRAFLRASGPSGRRIFAAFIRCRLCSSRGRGLRPSPVAAVASGCRLFGRAVLLKVSSLRGSLFRAVWLSWGPFAASSAAPGVIACAGCVASLRGLCCFPPPDHV